MKRCGMLLAVLSGAWAAEEGGEAPLPSPGQEAAPSQEPPVQPSPEEGQKNKKKRSLGQTQAALEEFFQSQGVTPAVEQEGILLLVGSTDPAFLKEANASCQRAIREFCRILDLPPEELQSEDNWLVISAKRSEHLALGKWVEERNPGAKEKKFAERFETMPGVGAFLCSDPSMVDVRAVGSLAVHRLGHMLLDTYQARHGGGEVPAWIREGLPAYLDAFVHQRPLCSCAAVVGYDKDEFKKRGGGADWVATVTKAVEQYKELKKKKKDMGGEPFRGLVPLSGRLFDKLSGEEVAVSWHVTTDLVKGNPKKFKAFLDALIGGQAQPEAFEAAFGEDLEAYEKAWMKGVLKDKPKK